MAKKTTPKKRGNESCIPLEETTPAPFAAGRKMVIAGSRTPGWFFATPTAVVWSPKDIDTLTDLSSIAVNLMRHRVSASGCPSTSTIRPRKLREGPRNDSGFIAAGMAPTSLFVARGRTPPAKTNGLAEKPRFPKVAVRRKSPRSIGTRPNKNVLLVSCCSSSRES